MHRELFREIMFTVKLFSRKFFRKTGYDTKIPLTYVTLCALHCTAHSFGKLGKFFLAHFRQKFRESKGFTKEITK